MQEENARLQRELDAARERRDAARTPRPASVISGGPLDVPRRDAPSPPPPPEPRAPPPLREASPLPPIAPQRGTPLQQLPPAQAILDEIARLQQLVATGAADAGVLQRITDLERQLMPPQAAAAVPGYGPMGVAGGAVGMGMGMGMGMVPAAGAYGMAPPAAAAPPPWLAAQMSAVQQQLAQMEAENKRLAEELRAAEERRRDQQQQQRSKGAHRLAVLTCSE
jgi:hypothetical protein